MGLENIEEKSIGYFLLKKVVGWWHNKIYYRNVTVIGKENIPADTPLIYTANHQNALMDALILLFSVNRIMVFVARADIFKNPRIAKILYFLKVMPIYRVRDGYESIKKTNDIIKRTVDVITSGCGMVVLPEGNHSSLRRLRPFKKGFARMAFQTEELNNFNANLHIVPVGIYYESRKKYRSSVIIQFGKPIPVAPYIDQYKKNPPIAYNAIKDELSEAIRPLIIDIKSVKNYELFNKLRTYNQFFSGSGNTDISNVYYDNFILQQKLISALCKEESINPDNIEKLDSTFTEFEKITRENKLSNYGKERVVSFLSLLFKTLGLIVLSPFSIYGCINNALQWFIPIWITNSKLKDKQFVSSFKFVLSMLLTPVFYFLQSLIVYLVFNDIVIAAIYLLSLPLTAGLALHQINCFAHICFNWRFLLHKRSRAYRKMIHFGDQISQMLSEYMKKEIG